MALTFEEEHGGQETEYGCLNHATSFMEVVYCEGGKENKSGRKPVRTICCSGEMCNNVSPPQLPTTSTTATQSRKYHQSTQTYRRTGVQRYCCTDIRSYRRTDVPTYSRTDVPTYSRTDVPTYRYTVIPTYSRTDVQT